MKNYVPTQICTQDLSVQEVEDIVHLRPLGLWIVYLDFSDSRKSFIM
jgi:hypothetical protein